MFDSPKELLDKIMLGEDSYLELKEARFAGDRITGPHRDSIADGLAALANTRGGVVLFGVEDGTREIVGVPVERLDALETWVKEICRDRLEPPLENVFIQRLTLPSMTGDSRAILKLDVPKSLFVHRSPGGYLHRIGSSKRVMSTEYLLRLSQQRSQIRTIGFDEQAIGNGTLADLDPALWERFSGPLMRDDREDFLHKLGMARQDEDRSWHPTVAGVLMATRDPRLWIKNAFIQAVAYRGSSTVPESTNANYQLDAKDIIGPLDEQAIEACRFVHRNMKVAASKDMGRHDIPQYDMGAIFEAVVNAVAHRDYSIHGSAIRLRMFADRLELHSPGAIANTMTVESLPYRQSSRNEAITSLLAKVPVQAGLGWLDTDRRTLMDRRGEGVRIILERSERLSGRKPEYRLVDDAELVLTIHGSRLDEALGGTGPGGKSGEAT
jgi:ATP-dependent DNA helicase RecG